MKNDFQQLVDRNLSGLQWGEVQAQRVLHALDRKGEAKMKKKFSTGLVLAMVCVLLATVAVATVRQTYSPTAQAKKLAMAALEEKYGLDTACMSLFLSYVEETDDGLLVVFSADFVIPAMQAGVYTVLVKDEEVTAAWSHDGTAADYQSGSLECEVWGEQQLRTCLAAEDLDALVAPYMENGPTGLPRGDDSFTMYLADGRPLKLHTDTATGKAVYSLKDAPVRTQPQDGDILRKEAFVLATAAVTDAYDLSETDSAALEQNSYYLFQHPDGQRVWELRLFLRKDNLTFSVMLDAQTGEIITMGVRQHP